MEAAASLTAEQVTGIFDFDIWKEDRISPNSAFQWLKIFGEIGTEELYNRFKDLDEDYQLAILGPYIRVYDQDEYEKMSDAQQDRVTALPASEFYYEITSADPDIFEGIENLIESTMAHNMAYTISLLAHACYMPPAEQEVLAAQFRKARIEEEGFVSFEESLSSFFSLNLDDKVRQWQPLVLKNGEGLASPASDVRSSGFLAKALAFGAKNKWNRAEVDTLNAGFIFVANNLCAASQIETDDERGLNMIVRQVKAMSGLALEVLSGGDLKLAAVILLKEHPKTLFRSGISLINLMRNQLLKTLGEAGLPEVRTVANLLAQGKFGQALEAIEINWLDSLGLQNLEILKAFFNRYPLRPVKLGCDGQAGGRLMFAPVDSLAALIDLQESLDGCFGLVELMKTAGPLSRNHSLDQSTNTAIVNALSSGIFSCQPISPATLELFCHLGTAEITEKSAKFIRSLKTNLQADEQWSLNAVTKKYHHYTALGSIDALIADLNRKISYVVDLQLSLQTMSARDLSALISIEQI